MTDRSARPSLLTLQAYPPEFERLLEQVGAVHRLHEAADRAAFLAEVGPEVRAVVTTGATGVPGDLWAALPRLELVAVAGVGLERIDLAQAGARGVRIVTTPDALTDDVADLAIALWFAVARRLVAYDAHVRAGGWERGEPLPLGRRVSGARVGVLGMGRIGQAIARRAAPFAASIAYYSRRPVAGVAPAWKPSPVTLAQASSVLFVAVPGGRATENMVDGAVLDALGPDGVLVNVARGSVVDEAALVAALREGRLGGAGLDVFRTEPTAAPGLAELANVVLQPHAGSATVDTRAAMAMTVLQALAAHFAA